MATLQLRQFADEELDQMRRRDAISQAYQDASLRKAASKTLRQRQLLTSLERLYYDPSLKDLCDMTVQCRGKSFKVHRAIICAQSEVISRSILEAEYPYILKLKCHPLVFEMTVQYLYTCDYTFFLDWNFPTRFLSEGQSVPGDGIDRLDCCELFLHMQVHKLAKYLRIPGLKYLSALKIMRVLYRSAFPVVFPRFVREVYKTTKHPNSFLRTLCVDYAQRVVNNSALRNHFDGRFPRYIFAELPEFQRDFVLRIGEDGPFDTLDCEREDILGKQRIARELWYV
ncbi:hypothetical protein BJY04DRAFT_217544 [Aspergillus karnatakaensis]|uniref:BTB/POZ domain-containing protein n=1 Tax=Aspergillus karnatakaensis TaxID=1810916 RepID=UPI003CCCF150